MRRLILMRHAKSSWAEAGQPDHDRPLNGRGKRAAAASGGWLAARGYLPEAALVSTAARAQATWAGLGPDFAAVPMTPRADLYHAGPDDMLRILRGAPDVGCVLMLGHQPGVGATAAQLLPSRPADSDFAKYPTSATAVIDFDVADWSAAGWGGGRLVSFVAPGKGKA